jgi:two-component system, OmpR family, alkaline phosphatase synthesis response regulator PhoP
MARERILVVHDDPIVFKTIQHLLPEDRFRVSYASTGEEALVKAYEEEPDLILLDADLPDPDGLAVCRELKRHPFVRDIPVVMLATQSEQADMVSDSETGADDYVTKPFGPQVLDTHIRAILRKEKRSSHESSVVRAGEVEIDPLRFRVSLGNRLVNLTVGEFKILHLLAKHPGWVFSRDQIITAVKGDDYAVTERSVDVHIVGLRKKLGQCGRLIETVRGVGYRFRDHEFRHPLAS